MLYNKKVPTGRSETPEEAMESSLLGLVEPSSQIFERGKTLLSDLLQEKQFNLISTC